MGHVIDVTERGEEAAVLTETRSGGLLGGRLLHDVPLATHLNDAECPRYVLHNRKEGLRIEREDEHERVAPDGDYRTLVAVTDVRVLFVTGRANGDVVSAVPLVEVVDAGVEDGLVRSSLWIETDRARYQFPCRGELHPVAAAIDERGQATVRSYRLLDEAREALAAADDHLSDDGFDAALDVVATADEKVQKARDRLDSVGAGALAAFDRDSADTRQRVRERPRAIRSARARSAHAEGQSSRGEGEFERACDWYERAIAAYRDARRCPGDEPADDELSARRGQAEIERDELQRAPLADAQQVAHGAASIDGPAPAAERWETAIRRYQDVLWLDWGRDERRFDDDPEAVRESIVDAVDNLVTERRAAARACREAAQAHGMGGADDAARGAYRTALTHLDRAQSVVDEVAPNRETGLDDTRAAVEGELAAVAGTTGDTAEGTDRRTTDTERGTVDAPDEGSVPGSLVAEYWTAHGWTVERDDADLLATCASPLELRAFVRVAGPQSGATPETVEDCAEMAEFVDADLAVLATDPDSSVRERATECDVHLLDLRDLVDGTITWSGSTKSA